MKPTRFSAAPGLVRKMGVCLVISLSSAAIAQHPVAVWLTTADGVNLLKAQPVVKWARSTEGPAIEIDDSKRFQAIDGFGHALTGGSAELLMKMSPVARAALLRELFGDGPSDIHTSYLRVTVGASDMNDHVFTYDDVAEGESDTELKHFSMAEDEKDVIPVLREILAIQPGIKIVASAWTPPAWMKDNGSFRGGALKPEFYEVYARYWVKYLQGMQSRGIRIDALTPQNEPENANNTPSLLMTADQEANFIGKYLGPALVAAGLKTKIIAFDHNCDHPIYPETVVRNVDSARYADGSGFHLYAGKIDALTEVHNAFPNKNVYFTEQMVIPEKNREGIAEPVARLIIGATENWSRTVLLWNLAADPHNGPHTPNGGCPICTGALTLDGDSVTRLVGYYTAAHASKFVPPGSVRIGSEASADSLPHVAFQTPSGDNVLIVSNVEKTAREVRIRYARHEAVTTLAAGAVATYVW